MLYNLTTIGAGYLYIVAMTVLFMVFIIVFFSLLSLPLSFIAFSTALLMVSSVISSLKRSGSISGMSEFLLYVAFNMTSNSKSRPVSSKSKLVSI